MVLNDAMDAKMAFFRLDEERAMLNSMVEEYKELTVSDNASLVKANKLSDLMTMQSAHVDGRAAELAEWLEPFVGESSEDIAYYLSAGKDATYREIIASELEKMASTDASPTHDAMLTM